ncbi:MAG: hypothetical protein JWM85_1148 [Acidimicrobiaceae bacterium]|nr:hypothetical protein [Acidimicrobiaceae bacterium]
MGSNSLTGRLSTVQSRNDADLRNPPVQQRSIWHRGRHDRRVLRHLLIPFALAGLALVFAACGGGSSASNTTTSGAKSTTSSGASSGSKSSGSSSSKASTTAYQACLKKNGVTLPSGGRGFGGGAPGGGTGGSGASSGTRPAGGAGGGAFSNPKFQKAFAACASLRPKGSGGFGGGFGGGGANTAALAAYRNCLKLHGVTLPTRSSSSTAGSSKPSTLNPSNPTVKAALTACAALRPKPTAAAGSTTTTTAS